MSASVSDWLFFWCFLGSSLNVALSARLWNLVWRFCTCDSVSWMIFPSSVNQGINDYNRFHFSYKMITANPQLLIVASITTEITWCGTLRTLEARIYAAHATMQANITPTICRGKKSNRPQLNHLTWRNRTRTPIGRNCNKPWWWQRRGRWWPESEHIPPVCGRLPCTRHRKHLRYSECTKMKGSVGVSWFPCISFVITRKLGGNIMTKTREQITLSPKLLQQLLGIASGGRWPPYWLFIQSLGPSIPQHSPCSCG